MDQINFQPPFHKLDCNYLYLRVATCTKLNGYIVKTLMIEAEQTEPLKRNLDLPHKPPAKKKMIIAKVDTALIFSRSRHACNSIAYRNANGKIFYLAIL